MHLVQILRPHAENAGGLLHREHVDQVKEELADSFEIVTAYLQAPADGPWQKKVQGTSDDVIFDVMTAVIDLPEWRARRAGFERRFRQNKVIFRSMPFARA